MTQDPEPGKIITTALDILNRDLAALPPGTKGALIATGTNEKATIAVVLRTGNNWSISAGLETRLKKLDPKFFIGVTKTW